MSLGLTRSPSLRRLFGRLRRGGGVVLGALVLGLAARAAGSEAPPAAEPAPIEELGPPAVATAPDPSATPSMNARIEPLGTTLEVRGTRRVLHLIARWRVSAPAGPLRLVVPSSQSTVQFRVAGPGTGTDLARPDEEPLRPDDIEREDGPTLRPSEGAAEQPDERLDEDVRIDPHSGKVYARGPVPRSLSSSGPVGRPPRPRFRHLLTVTVPSTGELLLEAAMLLSAGFDRRRWRETGFERSHALHLRTDPFVYQFAARGPGGPLQLVSPPNTSAAVRRDAATGRLLVAAAERRALPIGLTLGLGFAVSDRATAWVAGQPWPPRFDPGLDPGQEPSSSRTLWQGLVRGSLELLLPHRDSLALAADLGSDLRGHHHVTAAAVYQLYAPAWPFLPLSAHLDLGAACDVWQSAGSGLGLSVAPSLRCGPRLSLGLMARFIGLLPSIDVFPQPEKDPVTGAEHLTARYRFALLVQGGL